MLSKMNILTHFIRSAATSNSSSYEKTGSGEVCGLRQNTIVKILLMSRILKRLFHLKFLLFVFVCTYLVTYVLRKIIFADQVIPLSLFSSCVHCHLTSQVVS